MMNQPVILIADAEPLITLAYADALDTLLLPQWTVKMVDMVLHELTRSQTPTSQKIAAWVATQHLPVCTTRVFQHYQATLAAGELPRKAHLGEWAIQEVITGLALESVSTRSVLIFEDHKIAKAQFILPDHCQKVSTRAFLLFLEQQGWIESAQAIEQKALQAGRAFSRLRFPPEFSE